MTKPQTTKIPTIFGFLTWIVPVCFECSRDAHVQQIQAPVGRIQMEQPADIKLTRDDKPERKFFENPLTWHLGLWHTNNSQRVYIRSLTARPPEKGPFQEEDRFPIIIFQGRTPKFRGVHVLWVILTASLDLLCLWVNFYKPLRKVVSLLWCFHHRKGENFPNSKSENPHSPGTVSAKSCCCLNRPGGRVPPFIGSEKWQFGMEVVKLKPWVTSWEISSLTIFLV